MGTDAQSGSAPDQSAKLLILADDREAQAGVIEHLRLHANLLVQVRRLRTGDYAIPGKVQFERKTLADFAASIVDGRLISQALRMRASGPPGVLILEGTGCNPAKFGISRSAWLGTMVTLSVVFGIPVLRSAGPAETADLIRFAATQIARQIRGAPARPGYRPKGKRGRQLFILQGLPLVGPQRAEALLDRFGSVACVMQADADELAGVAGIGLRTAERIEDVVK